MSSRSERTTIAAVADGDDPTLLFEGSVEMGALMRDLDSSATAVGPVSRWPQSLRTAVGICLASRSPMLVWWGPELAVFYNDACRSLLGKSSQPRTMGKPGYAGCPEIWPLVAPALERAMATGEPTLSGDQMLSLERDSGMQNCYFMFSHSPIRDENGGVGGVFTVVTETTAFVVAERRLRILAERASQFEAIIEAMADGVFVCDCDGRVVHANSVLREQLGFDDGFLARPMDERGRLLEIHDSQGNPQPPEQWLISRSLRGEVVAEAQTGEVRMRTPDGRELQVSVTGGPVRDPSGDIVGAVGVIRDVTERQQLLRELEAHAAQLETVIGTMADGLMVFDAEGRVLRMNAAARGLLGLTEPTEWYLPPEAERTHLGRVLDNQGQPLPRKQWPYVRALRGEALTGSNTMDICYHTPDGRLIEVNVSGMPIRDARGQITGAVCAIRDVTERRRLERRAHETLQRMSDFLGIAGHELRTPLTVIKANIQLLERAERRRDGETAAGGTLLASTARQVERLNRLVNDLVDVSRIKQGKLEMRVEACDLASIVHETLQEQRLANPDRRISLRMARGARVPIYADGDRIGQVITNLLTNALKYSPVDSPVEVLVRMRDGGVRVSVRDHGPGIPREEQEQIWELFHRVPGIEVQCGSGIGLGLGLYICETVIAGHGGHVGLRSRVGHGSTFWFTLPLAL